MSPGRQARGTNPHPTPKSPNGAKVPHHLGPHPTSNASQDVSATEIGSASSVPTPTTTPPQLRKRRVREETGGVLLHKRTTSKTNPASEANQVPDAQCLMPPQTGHI